MFLSSRLSSIQDTLKYAHNNMRNSQRAYSTWIPAELTKIHLSISRMYIITVVLRAVQIYQTLSTNYSIAH